MTIPQGQLVTVVGPVRSGKSSLLQGLLGEIRKVSRHVSFGSRIGYYPQTMWIQNATLHDNITFGQSFEEDRYWHIIETACLLPNLQLLPDEDLTEIEEKGINLSGGQKQRVNIACALYFEPEIVIFDDPLLADYIYTLNNSFFMESGTYEDLVSRDGDFACFNLEFSGHASKGEVEIQEEEVILQTHITIEDVKLKSKRAKSRLLGVVQSSSSEMFPLIETVLKLHLNHLILLVQIIDMSSASYDSLQMSLDRTILLCSQPGIHNEAITNTVLEDTQELSYLEDVSTIQAEWA
ncbi:P-loop containing nucleoside triphosphate hydrolase protein [Suillus hirtellus]|nr:P-loop containing nucleoside triphosphate hydrolase protein [Suillus hirtellus]